MIKANQERAGEQVNENSLAKSHSSSTGAVRFFDQLVARYEENDEQNLHELIVNLAKEHAIWFSQAHESLYTTKLESEFAKVAPYLLASIQDRHLRFALGAQASMQGPDSMNQYLSSARKASGPSSMYFSSFNPNGRYRLNLGVYAEREVAKCLVAINKRVNAKIVAKKMCDRSQMGNQSCFRNERVNNCKFVMHVSTWNVPENGIFDFDF